MPGRLTDGVLSSSNLLETDFTNLSGSLLRLSAINKNQYLSVTDIISEGPIEGLSNGAASIYLEDGPAADDSQGGQALNNGPATFSLNGTTTVSSTNATLVPFTGGTSRGSKWLQVLNFLSLGGVDAELETATDITEIKITTPSAFFEDWMVESANQMEPYIELSIDSVTYFVGTISKRNSDTEAIVVPYGGLSPVYVDKTSGEYTISLHASLEISSISSNTITLADATYVPGTTGTPIIYKCNISDARYSSGFGSGNTISDTSKYKGFSYQFRVGLFNQPPIDDLYQGSGATSILAPVEFAAAFTYEDSTPSVANAALQGLTGGRVWPYLGAGFSNEIERSSTQLGLSSATAGQVDEVKVVISYPSGLIVRNKEGTSINQGLQAYQIFIATDKGQGFGAYQTFKLDGEFFYHIGETSSSFYMQQNLSLNRFKPFKDFKLKFVKATRDDVNPRSDGTYDDSGNIVNLSSTLTSAVSIIRERFIYPFTAYANVRINAEEFPKIPKRSYLCKGRQILVPSNYVTREESGGIANYKRNVSTGAIESIDQDWNGRFRPLLVYTDNPAWVFLDIISNSRYGLGTWLKKDDIDIYALYRIARYCDEEVPDGEGGTEPRFRANIYLSKKTDTYKVLKDMATTFRAILYWSEGNIMPVTDMAREPVYNFTKGNVIEGQFVYEGTGNKVRSNQIGVTWNNPDNDYVPEVLVVEDRENIVKTGKIITEEAVAFGATSMGQATRYGRWKLWTAINQTEVVNFKTAINATFISPGDIVNIQDADRYDTAYSGRISKTAGTDNNTVKLDRSITLNSGSTYDLSVLIEEPAVFLAQDKATISSVDYVKGDMLPDSLYTSEETASDIKDANNVIVQINWAPYTHVETKPVTAATISATQPISSIDVEGTFTAVPNAETIWALKETEGALEVSGSKKMYKVLSIKEAGKNIYDISAVEHYNEKFDAVDKDFARPYVDTMLTPSVFVPPITNLTVTVGTYEH